LYQGGVRNKIAPRKHAMIVVRVFCDCELQNADCGFEDLQSTFFLCLIREMLSAQPVKSFGGAAPTTLRRPFDTRRRNRKV
jgi:hypothetical protein